MVFDKTIHGADLANIILELPTTVTIGGSDYSCYKTIVDRNRSYNDWGFGDDYFFTIILNLNSITAPDNHTLVTIDGVEYRILRKEVGAGTKVLKLHLGDKYGST